MKRVLFIGGTDPCGGAGLQADLRTATAFKVWGLSVVTAVVVQNTSRVSSISSVGSEVLEAQLESVVEDIVFDAIKIGMIASLENLEVVRVFIKKQRHLPIVLDPIYFDGSGETRLASDLLFKKMLGALGENVSIITPNSKEALAWEEGDLVEVLQRLHAYGPDVLLKSGHLDSKNRDYIFDYWCDKEGIKELKAYPRKDVDPRGTGCHLASAIACGLAQGKTPIEAVEEARKWLASKFQNGLISIGQGRPLIGN